MVTTPGTVGHEATRMLDHDPARPQPDKAAGLRAGGGDRSPASTAWQFSVATASLSPTQTQNGDTHRDVRGDPGPQPVSEREPSVLALGYPSRHAPAARPLSAAHGPGPLPSYYEDTHLPLTAKLPGLRGYRYSFDVAAAEGESPYFCVFEADFDDAAALGAARASPRARRCADIPNYATGGAVALNYAFALAEPQGWMTARTATGPSASAGGDRPGTRHGDRNAGRTPADCPGCAPSRAESFADETHRGPETTTTAHKMAHAWHRAEPAREYGLTMRPRERSSHYS